MRTCAVVVSVLLLSLSAGVRAQSAEKPLDPAFAKELDRYMELTGVFKLGQQISSSLVQQALQGLRQANPAIPPRAAEIIREMIEAEFAKVYEPSGPLAQDVKRIYAKHFTREDIRGLIAFYETPLGKKVLLTLPVVGQESMNVGLQWAKQRMPALMQEIQARLKKEGIVK